MVKVLLNNGANVNVSSGSPLDSLLLDSSLRAALENGHENMVKLLFDNGADINADD